MKWFRHRTGLAILLLPLAFLYWLLITLRRWLYQQGFLSKTKVSVPVIVVGNINVGGTGKTPTVIALCHWLQELGYAPGVVSRGYKGKAPQYPLSINEETNPSWCGDEPLLIRKKTQCPVVVDPNRVAAAQYLIKHEACNVIISDDGLQHYALERDVEIALVPAKRDFGNGWLLPAGPLREPISRLDTVDYILTKGESVAEEHSLKLQVSCLYQLTTDKQGELFDWQKLKVHAVAGIAKPQEFFDLLRSYKLTVIEHPFPDHYAYQASDCDFNKEGYPIVMTEKDAVKCKTFADDYFFAVGIELSIPKVVLDGIRSRLSGFVYE